MNTDDSTIAICIPQAVTDTFYFRRYFYNDCSKVELDEKFDVDLDEYIDDVQVREDYIVTVTIRSKGRPDKFRTRLFNIRDADFGGVPDGTYVTANTKAVFNVPKRFKKGTTPKVHV